MLAVLFWLEGLGLFWIIWLVGRDVFWVWVVCLGWSIGVLRGVPVDDEPESLILAQSERWRNA